MAWRRSAANRTGTYSHLPLRGQPPPHARFGPTAAFNNSAFVLSHFAVVGGKKELPGPAGPGGRKENNPRAASLASRRPGSPNEQFVGILRHSAADKTEGVAATRGRARTLSAQQWLGPVTARDAPSLPSGLASGLAWGSGAAQDGVIMCRGGAADPARGRGPGPQPPSLPRRFV